MSFDFANINGTKIHYEVRGQGTAVTLIHAGIANLNMWDDQMDTLAKDHQVLRYDVRGWGETADPPAAYTDHDDLRGLLQHLDIAQTAIVGCSGGGKIALDFALAYPDMVSALMLVGSGLGGYTWTMAGFAGKAEALAAAYKQGDKATAAELQAQIWVDGPDRAPAQVNQAARQRALDMIRHTLALPEGEGQRHEMDPPTINRLAEVQVPVHIIVGQYDVPDIHTIAQLLEAQLPLADELTIMRHTAHLPNMERPSTFNQLVLDFLEKAAWQAAIYAVLPHETEAQIWLKPTSHGFALPHTKMAGNLWDTGEALVKRPLQRRFGDAVQVLYRAHFQKDEAQQTSESVFVLDNGGAVVGDGRWVSAQELTALTLANPAHRALIERCLHEQATGDIPAQRPPWARPGWHQQAASWIKDQLAQQGTTLTGPLETVRHWSLSCVLRAVTPAGNVYFKTVAALPLFVNEAAMVTTLCQLYPQDVPTPLAVDLQRDWMLLPELTQMVGWGAPLEQRLAFLSRFGRLQVTAVTHLEALFAAGCLDRRLAWLETQIEPLLTTDFIRAYITADEQAQLSARIPRLQSLCRELAAYHIPETLVHGDLHGGNVAVCGDHFLYFDWTDACISHPFFDMLNIFMEEDTAVQTQLRDAYLDQWTAFESRPRLLTAWSLAEVLGAVHHAISYGYIVSNLEPHARHELDRAVPYWLRKVLTLVQQLEETDGR